MWGEVTPAERLRALARRGRGGDLAAGAADALAAYATDPAALVVACRRLIAHHPADAVLLWTCARMLSTADPTAEARIVTERLRRDPTGRRLADALPLLDPGELVAALGWSPTLGRALDERPDLPVAVYRARGADPRDAPGGFEPDRALRVLDPWEPPPDPVAILLVPAFLVAPDYALVAAGLSEVVEVCEPRERWLVAPEGTCLPAPLALRIRTAAGAGVIATELTHYARAVGPRGASTPEELAGRPDCPVAPELLRP